MKLILGDCLEKLKELEDNSIDAIVTDPPYGISFMSKKWDYDVPSVEVWVECLRVLKPGGYLLSFAGTRTQHRMAVRIEDAGFEIRDMIAWIYGSGFPKSLNIGKAVDKLQGNEREAVGKNPNYRPVSGKIGYLEQSNFRQTDGMSISTKGTSEWEGWGTALKPALEPITVARKPLSEKTVAENCLKWGVGGINIDGCRVEFTGKEDIGVYDNNRRGLTERSKLNEGDKTTEDKTYDGGWKKQNKTPELPQGRFPANLIHDGSDEVVSLFPNTKSGTLKSDCYKGDRENDSIFAGAGKYEHKGYKADSGSASRFFYCAKASKSERNKGLEGFEEKERVDYGGFHSEKGLIKNNRNPENRVPMKNNHPTVKPVKLMQYLCRLITPKGGVILDPYMGSGTTGIGSKLEGFDFIGIEIVPEYYELAKSRIGNTATLFKLLKEKE